MSHRIYFHADDYGVCREQCLKIIDCHEQGVCNSISVIANSPYLSESFALLNNDCAKPFDRIVTHLNLIEGYSVAPASEVPFLLNENGMLKCTFGGLLKSSFALPRKKKALKEQIKKEFAAQLAAVSALNGSKHVCIDSHQHFHMIPFVFDALCAAVRENGYIVDSLRIPVDPIRPLLRTPRLLLHISPISCIKHGILRFLSWFIISKAKKLSTDIPVFFGMFFTCRMEYRFVAPLLKQYDRIARKKNRNLELMFHPGGVYRSSFLLDASNKQLVDFYGSDLRKKEADTLMRLSKEHL